MNMFVLKLKTSKIILLLKSNSLLYRLYEKINKNSVNLI